MLHGDIRVNGHKIGGWEAQCLSAVPFNQRRLRNDAVADYRYAVELNHEHFVGQVRHRYGDGAAVLLAKVMADAEDLALSD